MDFLTDVLIVIGVVTLVVAALLILGSVADWFDKVNKAADEVKVEGGEYDRTSRIADLADKVSDFERRFKALDEYVDTSKYAVSVAFQQKRRWSDFLEPIQRNIAILFRNDQEFHLASKDLDARLKKVGERLTTAERDQDCFYRELEDLKARIATVEQAKAKK